MATRVTALSAYVSRSARGSIENIGLVYYLLLSKVRVRMVPQRESNTIHKIFTQQTHVDEPHHCINAV